MNRVLKFLLMVPILSAEEEKTVRAKVPTGN